MKEAMWLEQEEPGPGVVRYELTQSCGDLYYKGFYHKSDVELSKSLSTDEFNKL